MGAAARLMCDAGLVTLTAFVSLYRADRDAMRGSIDAGPPIPDELAAELIEFLVSWKIIR